MSIFDSVKVAHLEPTELAMRVKWYVYIRWLILACVALPNIVAQLILRSHNIPLAHNLNLTIAVILYNLGLLALLKRRRSVRFYNALVILQLVVDSMAISYLIYANGGIESHSVLLFAIPILVTGVFFHRHSMLTTALIIATFYTILVSLEFSGRIASPTGQLLALDVNGFLIELLFVDSVLVILAIIGNYFVDLWQSSLESLHKERLLSSSLYKQEREDAINYASRTQALFDSIGEALIVVNEYGNITDVNKIAQQLLGFSHKELLGQWFPKAVVAIDSEQNPVVLAKRPLLKALETGRPVRAEMNYVTKSGKHLPVAMVATPFIRNDKPVGGVIVFRDFSREASVDKAKNEFVSLASHQLRTPATAVKNFIGLLRDGYAGKLTKEQAEYINQAYDSNEYELQIITDLLNVARTEAGTLKLAKERQDMTLFIERIITEQAATIEKRRQHITFKKPDKPVEVLFDPDKTHMVLENIINNASKYTKPGGSIRVALKSLRTTIEIDISDSGVGIAKADLPKLFGKFSRIDNELSTLVGGTGLGLYLAKRLVSLHGGSIHVKSSIGKGTTFTIVLPKAKEK